MEGQRDLFGEAGQVGWDVRRSVRARRLAIRVHPEGRVEIIVPAHASASVVQTFVARHRNWIERKLAEQRKARMQVRAKEAQIAGTPDGTMTRDDARVRPQIKKSYAAMEIPKK